MPIDIRVVRRLSRIDIGDKLERTRGLVKRVAAGARERQALVGALGIRVGPQSEVESLELTGAGVLVLGTRDSGRQLL